MTGFWNNLWSSRHRRGALWGVVLGIALAPGGKIAASEPGRNTAEGSSAAVDIAVVLASSEEDDSGAAIDATNYEQASQDAVDESTAQQGDEPPVRPAPPAEEVKPSEDVDTRRPYLPITQVEADARLPEGLLPEQVGREEGKIAPSPAMPEIGDSRLDTGWAENNFQWSATRLCHGPLYFEEINLERYGYQCHPAVQPLVSGAHFFLTAPTLPYQMTVHPPRECIYTLGYYRPGSRVPWQRSCLPWDPRAAAVEAGVAVGLVFLIP